MRLKDLTVQIKVHVYGFKLAADWLEVCGWLAPVIGRPAARARALGGFGVRWLVWARVGNKVCRLLPSATLEASK